MNTATETNTNAIPPRLDEVAQPPQSGPENDHTPHEAAVSNLIVGGLWCVGGILVTALTYSAVQESGGYFIIAWGAILFGGFQFLQGLFQLGNPVEDTQHGEERS